MLRSTAIVPLIALSCCIGTDIVEGPSGNEKLELSPKAESLLVGQTVQLNATYTNPLGEIENISPEFQSLDPSILSVGPSGLVTSLEVGQGKVYATYELIFSDTVTINVVASETDIAEIIIIGSTANIGIGEEITLTANAYTVNDVPVVTSFSWSSEDPEVATVNNDGLVQGLSKGFTEIVAQADGIEGRYGLSVGLNFAMATFMGSSGYVAKGSAELRLNGNNLLLTLSDDFETSFALGTFVYLANSTNGPEVKANGFEVAEITMNGSHTFNLSEIAENMDTSVSIGEYMYVVILCEPASLTFGYGEIMLQP